MAFGQRVKECPRLPFSSQQLTQRLSWHWHHEAGLPLHPFLMPGSHWKAAGQTGVGRRNAEPRPLLRDGGKPVRPGSCGSPVLRSLLSHWQSGCEAAEFKEKVSLSCAELISPDIQSWAILAPLSSRKALGQPVTFSRNTEVSQIVLITTFSCPDTSQARAKLPRGPADEFPSM